MLARTVTKQNVWNVSLAYAVLIAGLIAIYTDLFVFIKADQVHTQVKVLSAFFIPLTFLSFWMIKVSRTFSVDTYFKERILSAVEKYLVFSIALFYGMMVTLIFCNLIPGCIIIEKTSKLPGDGLEVLLLIIPYFSLLFLGSILFWDIGLGLKSNKMMIEVIVIAVIGGTGIPFLFSVLPSSLPELTSLVLLIDNLVFIYVTQSHMYLEGHGKYLYSIWGTIMITSSCYCLIR